MVGGTGSGKTVFTKTLLQNAETMVDPPFEKIFWAYSEWQPAYKDMVGVEFVKGLNEDVVKRENLKGHSCVVIDDLSDEIDGKFLGALFTKISHHRNLSVIFLLNNLFFKGVKTMRLVSLNTHYMVIFKTPRDQGSIATIARQMYGKDYKLMVSAYQEATKEKFGYLIVDSKSDTPEDIRLRTAIFQSVPICNIAPNGKTQS